MNSCNKLVCWAVGACVVLVLTGVVMLRAPDAMPRGMEMNFDRAVFTAVNAATLTGFQQPTAVEAYKPLGRGIVAALMVCGTLVWLTVGGCLLSRALRLAWTDVQVLVAVLATFALAVICGAAMLIAPGRGLWAALFQAASALGNCGLALGPLPGGRDLLTHVALLPLVLIGGLGVPVLMEYVSAFGNRRRAHSHATAAVTSWAGVYLLGLLAVLLSEIMAGAAVRDAAPIASVAAANARTAGLPLGSLAALSRASQWIVTLLMMIGGCPGSASGGIKTTTLIVLWVGIRAALNGRPAGRVFGIACSWLLGYIAIVLAAVLILLGTQPQLAGDRVLMLCVSAASNVGLWHEPVSITGTGLYTLSATMLAGRLVPVLLLWWCTRVTDRLETAVG